MSFIFLLGTVFLHNFRAELIMGPKFFVFIFVLCLYGLMVSQARLGPPKPQGPPAPSGSQDIKKYRQSIENALPPGPYGRRFRENDVKIGEK